MARGSNTNFRARPAERLQAIDVERVAAKLARDFAKHTARVTVGDDLMPANHADLRDALRDVIREQLQRARERA